MTRAEIGADGLAQDNGWRARALSFRLWSVLVLAVSLLLSYARALPLGPVWDDTNLIIDNPFLRSLNGLRTLVTSDLWTASASQEASSFYRPFTMLTYALHTWLTGLTPPPVRALNLLLHFLSATLLMALIRKHLPALPRHLALICALLWALAPVNSEAVIWLAGRFDLLVGVFALTLLTLNSRGDRQGNVGIFIVVACGLLSKENFLAWLPMLFLDDMLVQRRPLRTLLPKYGAIALEVALYLLTRRALGIATASVVPEGGLEEAVRAYLFALHTFLPLLVWPVALDPFHPYEFLPFLRLLPTLLAVALTTGFLIWRGLRKRASRRARLALLGQCFFLLSLFPSSLTGPTLRMIGDRYLYLPLIGLALTLAAGLEWVYSELEPRVRPGLKHAIFILLPVSLCLMSGLRIVQRSADWEDDRSLALASLSSHPENPYALYSLGHMAAMGGRLQEADELLARAYQGNPGAWRTLSTLCFVRLKQNRLEEAKTLCTESKEINPRNPRVWLNLSVIAFIREEWGTSLEQAKRAQALKPNLVQAYVMAARAAHHLGMEEEVSTQVARGLELSPAEPALLELSSQGGLQERSTP